MAVIPLIRRSKALLISHLNKLVYERTSYMNKIYKVVWNNTLQCYTVVSELAKSHTKNNASKVVKATVLSSLLAVASSTYAAQGGISK